jgi:hypothetical protein
MYDYIYSYKDLTIPPLLHCISEPIKCRNLFSALMLTQAELGLLHLVVFFLQSQNNGASARTPTSRLPPAPSQPDVRNVNDIGVLLDY